MFAAKEASGVNKRELYKQNKEAQLMERLERRMEGMQSRAKLEVILVSCNSTTLACPSHAECLHDVPAPYYCN